MTSFAKNYRAADLTFDADGIYWVNPEDNETYQVMMSWEQPIMDKMAELCVTEGDDVLEIGFGMGILSNAIQLKKPKSHTIVECHKDIIPKLKEWAKDKSNVIIIEGLWTEVLDKYGKYNCILQDTYGDEYRHALKRDRINFLDWIEECYHREIARIKCKICLVFSPFIFMVSPSIIIAFPSEIIHLSLSIF